MYIVQRQILKVVENGSIISTALATPNTIKSLTISAMMRRIAKEFEILPRSELLHDFLLLHSRTVTTQIDYTNRTETSLAKPLPKPVI